MPVKEFQKKTNLINLSPKLAKKIKFEIKGDYRGSLIPIENRKNIPFDIKRIFYIFGTKKGVSRGKHAHKNLKEILICVNGSCKIKLDNGYEREIIELNSPDEGLYIDNLIWIEMFDFSHDCVLLVLTDDFYRESDYIREYTEFLRIVKG